MIYLAMMIDNHKSPAERRAAGNGLIATGYTIICLCGACTLLFDGNIVLSIQRTGQDEFGAGAFSLLVSIFVGGLPILLGVALVFKGRSLLRPGR